MGEETSETFHESSGHRAVPLRIVRPRGDLIRSGSKGSVLGDNAQAELFFVDSVAEIVPTTVKFPPELFDPVPRRVMRGVHRWSGEVTEPWTVGRRHPMTFDPRDGLVR